MKTLILIFLILNLTNQSCLKGCLKCSPNNTCLLCDTTSFYSSDQDSCIKVEQKNCQKINLIGNCISCNDGYWLNPSSMTCVVVESLKQVLNCKIYSNAQICLACKPGFFVNLAKCKSVLEKILNCSDYGAESMCVECQNGFFVSSDGKSCEKVPDIFGCDQISRFECESCSENFILNRNFYFESSFKTISTTEKEKILTDISNRKQKLTILKNNIPICQEKTVKNCSIHKTFKTCKECSPKYFLTQSLTCQKYPITIITNCQNYSSNTKCSFCNQGFYLQNPSTCQQTTPILNCSQYSQTKNTTICTICKGEFYIVNGTSCSQRKISAASLIANCKEKAVDSDRCGKCNDEFVLASGGDECVRVLGNCRVYNSFVKGSGVSCAGCVEGFFLGEGECVQGSDGNCLGYFNTGSCDVCRNKFYHEGDNACVEHVSLANCEVYHNTIKNTCKSCDNKTFNFEVEKLCTLLSEIPNCLTYNHAENATTASCSSCEEGYYLNNSTSCDKISIANCKTGSSPTTCTHCKTGFIIYNTGQNKQCLPPHEYMTDQCETLENTGDQNGLKNVTCKNCKINAFPVDYTNNYVCINNLYLSDADSIGLVTIIEGCVKYESRTLCGMCGKGKFLQADKLKCLNDCGGNPYSVFDLVNVSVGGNTHKVVRNAHICDVVGGGDGNVEIYAYDYEFGKYIFKCKDDSITVVYADLTSETYSTNINLKGSLGNMFDDVRQVTVEVLCPTDATNINGTGTGDLVDNCEYYIEDNAPKYGCLKCKHGYHGKSETNGKYIESCISMSTCNSGVTYGNLQETFSQYFSCHKCNDNSKIPFLIYKFNSNTDIEYKNFRQYTLSANGGVYSATNDNNTIECLNTQSEPSFKSEIGSTNTTTQNFLIPNCGLGLFNINLTNKSDDFFTKCATCKPGYKPAANEPSQTEAIYATVSSCTKIDNCESSTWFNACSKCRNGYVYRVVGGFIEYGECVRAADEGCFASDGEDLNCVFCKRGFVLNEDGVCGVLNTSKCQSGKFDGYLTIHEDSYKNAQYFYWYSQEGAGCNQCDSGYTAVKYDSDFFTAKSCGLSSFVTTNATNFPNQSTGSIPSNFINNCESYVVGVGIKCNKCNSNFILRSDGSECITLLNCETALNAGSFCKVCKSGYGLVNNLCVAGNIPNCKTYNTSRNQTSIICEICNQNFYRKKNQCAPGSISNCLLHGSSPTDCQTCLPGYFKIPKTQLSPTAHDYCYKIATPLNCSAISTTNSSLGAKLTCTTCSVPYSKKHAPLPEESQTNCLEITTIENCEIYHTKASLAISTLLCERCKNGFYAARDGFECVERTVMPVACSEFVDDKDFCSQCNEGNFLETDGRDCVVFPSGIIGCLEYSDAKTCIECVSGFWVYKGGCREIVQEAIIENCLVYTNALTCGTCQFNYFLEGNLCVAINVTNCEIVASKDACETCLQGFRLITENGKTTCESFTKPNCKTYKQGTTNPCTLCNQNHYINAEGNCTQTNPIITNCLTNASINTCSLCAQGFALSKDKKSCQIALEFDNNCSIAIIPENMSCSKCKAGYYFKNNVCVEFIGTNSIENGCFSLDFKDPNVCLVCNSGFFMNSLGNCVNVVSGYETNSVLVEERDGVFRNLIGVFVFFILVF